MRPDLHKTIVDVSAVLCARHIQLYLTGGLVSSFYGEPRFTQDIDIVVLINGGSSLEQLIKDLSGKFIVDREAIEDAVKRGSIFQALHEETMIKVDFHVGEAIPGELSRSKAQEILTGVVVPIVSKEDAILSKLIWIKKGSNKSRHDVRGMLKREGEIDLEYLQVNARMLGVDQILEDLKSRLDEDQIA